MSRVAVSLTVTFDHEPGHALAPEDRALNAVEFGFSELEVPAEIVIDDVNLVRRHPSFGQSGDNAT